MNCDVKEILLDMFRKNFYHFTKILFDNLIDIWEWIIGNDLKKVNIKGNELLEILENEVKNNDMLCQWKSEYDYTKDKIYLINEKEYCICRYLMEEFGISFDYAYLFIKSLGSSTYCHDEEHKD